jgi:hypothetical protein
LKHVGGKIGPAMSWNPYWSFHLTPSTVYFFEQQVEVCDASVCAVNRDGPPSSSWCPWASRLIGEIPSTAVSDCIRHPSC